MRTTLLLLTALPLLVCCSAETAPAARSAQPPGDAVDPTDPASPGAGGSTTPGEPGPTDHAGEHGTPTEPAGDQRLFPAEIGRAWTYRAESTYNGQTTTSNLVMTITDKTTIDGVDAYVLGYSTTPTVQYMRVIGDDDVLYRSPAGDWFPSAKSPVQEGATWTYQYSGTRQQTWHKAKTTTVTAGSFDDCWRLDNAVLETSGPNDVNYSVICRGVGTVLVVMELSNGYATRQELVNKNF